MKNRKYFYPGLAAIFCALIAVLGWVYLVYSSPGTTVIGEDISTTNLTVTGNATTTGNQVVSGTLNVTGTSTLATTTVNGALNISEGALTNSTVLSVDIKDGEIVNADISTNAVISLSKLATSTSGYIIVLDASGVPTYVAMSGEVTISNTGTTTIASNAITNAKMADDSIKQAELDYEVATVNVVPAANNGTTTVTSGAEILGYYPTTNDGKVVNSISISGTTLTLTVNSTSTATTTFKIPLLKP